MSCSTYAGFLLVPNNLLLFLSKKLFMGKKNVLVVLGLLRLLASLARQTHKGAFTGLSVNYRYASSYYAY